MLKSKNEEYINILIKELKTKKIEKQKEIVEKIIFCLKTQFETNSIVKTNILILDEISKNYKYETLNIEKEQITPEIFSYLDELFLTQQQEQVIF